MEQRIRFCEIDGRRIAYAEAGSGPALVLPSPWVGNVHTDWEYPDYRFFVEQLAAEHTVIRYDRPGTGLSDRELPEEMSLEYDVHVLEELLGEIGCERASLFGLSCGGSIAVEFAARNPDATDALVLTGCYADGSRLANPAVRESIVSVIRASWGLGARMLADLFVPGASQEERAQWTRFQRESADADSAAQLYELIYTYDTSTSASEAGAPALVLHRRGDRAVAFELGRELASILPNARFVQLDGDRHLPWHGDSEALLTETRSFLAAQRSEREPTGADGAAGPEPAAAPQRAPAQPVDAPELSNRELEVLRLVAEGLSDPEIAERLVLSPHTVHRHVANIRTKLRQPSRAAAAARAARIGLI
ncbi:MAG TPA: alpha/beta fold hydrolase [Solirubrobacterales bacterium]|nr:alpha/beta fold hydrolase [Solirubrobacterales bacterium]